MIAHPGDASIARNPGVLTVRITAGVLCMLGAAIVAWEFYRFLLVFPAAAILAVVLELPLLVIGFSVIRLLRPVEQPPLIWSGAALIWGASAATGYALVANAGLISLWAKTAGVTFASNWSASLSAPLNEEIFKLCGVVMIVLAAPRALRGPVDGMIFGALTGLGFQVIENVTYGLDNIVQSGAVTPDGAVQRSVLLRVGATGLGSHWTMTAVSGAGIGYLVALSARGRRNEGIALAIACLLLAMGMHLLFNAPHPPLPLKVGVNFVIISVLYLHVREAYLRRARRLLAGYAASGAITAGEAAGVLSRRYRRSQLQRITSAGERERLFRRQHQILDVIGDEAA